ncbi:MAG: tetratricopeptide repeat protein [bacterium]|nr:tetratricopeptide repeat protein [bacterium]
MRRLPLRAALALTLFALHPLVLAASTDPTLVQAEALLGQHQPKSAFDLLAPLEDERAGDPDYDYLYGQAALESGQSSIAAFAFERCLATDPKNGPCRMQMARAHMALGENASAREELALVEQSQPPAEVTALIQQYLGALSQRGISEKRRVSGYVQLGLGYDSNVSSSTSNTQIALPAFGGLPFTLNGVATRQEDRFQQAAAGASVEYSLNPAWSLLGDAALSGRVYPDQDTFNNQVSDAALGAAYRAGHSSLLAKFQAQDYRLDNNAFRSLYGILTQYQYAASENAAASAYVQASHLDYHLKGTPDARRYTVGAGYSQAFNGDLAPALYAGLYGGQENSDGNDYLSQDFYGLRLGGSLGLSSQVRLTASLSVEQRKFGGTDPLFLVTREDTGTDLGLGAVYQPTPHFSVRPTYTYSKNTSNIVLSDYDRHVISLDLRYGM